MRDLGPRPTRLFPHGWSQGALNTLWPHRSLRSAGRDIAATAVASPFNDLIQAWRLRSGRESFLLPAGWKATPECRPGFRCA
jgi:hypothetical protein